MSIEAEIARIRKQYFIWNKPRPRAANLNRELCRFFEGIKASILLDGHLRAGPMQFVTPRVIRLRVGETALRTKAPAVVPASRCAPDPKPSRKAATRGKRRSQKKAR